jgi:hypothetical protein
LGKLQQTKNKNMAKEKIKKTEFSISGYYKPTPTKFRKIGDALLIVSTIVSSQYPENPKVMIISQVVGLLGKFLTNFFH